jgi:hypothetical protein
MAFYSVVLGHISLFITSIDCISGERASNSWRLKFLVDGNMLEYFYGY